MKILIILGSFFSSLVSDLVALGDNDDLIDLLKKLEVSIPAIGGLDDRGAMLKVNEEGYTRMRLAAWSDIVSKKSKSNHQVLLQFFESKSPFVRYISMRSYAQLKGKDWWGLLAMQLERAALPLTSKRFKELNQEVKALGKL